ncbi:MAG: SufE family protein [Fimbriimonadaceae bacterium]|nr:MAG: SufE family protein [Fimbriimonadaceae bacterium]
MPYPEPIQGFIETLSFLEDRADRIQALIELSKSYQPAPHEKPYPTENRVPGCESEVYTWVSLKEGALDIEIVVDNPQGLSAMALAALLSEALQGKSPSSAESLDGELVFALFGRELSMGKSLGLTNLVQQVKAQSLKLA